MIAVIFNLFIIICLAMSCSPTQKPNRGINSLDGVWQAEHLEMEGQAGSPEAVKSILLTIRGESLMIQLDGENSPVKKASIRVDSTKSPGQFDLSANDGGMESVSGIFELSRDTLKICLNANPGSPRPDRFETKENSERILMIFKKLR